MHKNEKKRQYSSRVLDVEHETFMLLVFTTTDRMGQEYLRYQSPCEADGAIEGETVRAKTISWIRAKTSFALLKSAFIC